MPPKAKAKKEKLQTRTPAEFFAENQNIAGFDNPGKSLFTTLRELTENSLDAAESIGALPNIELQVTELSLAELNKLQGLGTHDRVDSTLYAVKGSAKGSRKKAKEEADAAAAIAATEAAAAGSSTAGGGGKPGSKTDLLLQRSVSAPPDLVSATSAAASAATPDAEPGKRKRVKGQRSYYRVSCRDNGVGMEHSNIPDMFGRVLAGTKYVVRQTRGKFGLGAKMALIWSKKSTGLPITIRSAHSTDKDTPPTHVSHYELDIDIHKNEPVVLQERKVPFAQAEAEAEAGAGDSSGGGACNDGGDGGWRGTRVTVTVEGRWSTYKARIVQYLQELAVITPYARFSIAYSCTEDPSKDFSMVFERRSDRMPALPQTTLHHPSAVNDLKLTELLRQQPNITLQSFLSKHMWGISAALASRLFQEFGEKDGFSKGLKCRDLTGPQVTRVARVLSQCTQFKPPDGACLSPAGEYNLRLGILKEIKPETTAGGEHLVATHSNKGKPGVHEGHAFVIEAGVSLGCTGDRLKEGINVHRFANRIPLLFEEGADVATQVAKKSIKWSSYKIDHKRDKVGVFVSIVSTKIPFKGTGKEYIGSDITEIRAEVKKCLQNCCNQLKQKLIKRNEAKGRKERRKNLTRYAPDASRALYGILDRMRKRTAEDAAESGAGTDASGRGSKRQRTAATAAGGNGGSGSEDTEAVSMVHPQYAALRQRTLQRMEREEVSSEVLQAKLVSAVDKGEHEAEEALAKAGKGVDIETFFLVPLPKVPQPIDLKHPTCFLRLLRTN